MLAGLGAFGGAQPHARQNPFGVAARNRAARANLPGSLPDAPDPARHQAGLGRFEDPGERVAPQAIRRPMEAGLLTRFGQHVEIILPVHPIQIDVFPAVTPAHDVADGPGRFHSHLARHGAKAAFSPNPPQAK